VHGAQGARVRWVQGAGTRTRKVCALHAGAHLAVAGLAADSTPVEPLCTKAGGRSYL